jgi:hypothetical protein
MGAVAGIPELEKESRIHDLFESSGKAATAPIFFL